MNAAAVQGSRKVEDAPPARPLWQVPLFLLGVGVLVAVCLTRPRGGDLAGWQVDNALRDVRRVLTRPDLDAAQAEKAVLTAARAVEQAQAAPDREGEARYLHGVAQVRLAQVLDDPKRVDELWHGAFADFEAALHLSVPEGDRGRLNYRRAQAGFWTQEDPAAVAARLQESAELAEDKAEAYGLLVKACCDQKPPKLKEALAANEKLRLVPPPVSEEVLAAARLQGGELLLRPDWPTRDANERRKRVEEASKVLENVRAPGAPPRVVLEAALLRGQCYMELDRWAEAGTLWKKLLDEGGPTWALRGKVLYLQGKCFCKVDPPQLAEAEKAWEACAAAAHSESPAHKPEAQAREYAAAADLARADLLVQQQRWDQVAPALDRALQHVRKPADWANPLLTLARLCDQFEGTLAVLSRAGAYDVALHVVDVYGRVAVPGRAARLRGDLSAGWAHGLRSLAGFWLVPQDEAVRSLLRQAGKAYTTSADEATASAAPKGADEAAEALWLAASCLFEAGDADSTREVLTRYLQAKEPPAHAAEAWFRLGDLLDRDKRPDEAEKAFRACITGVGSTTLVAQRARCRLAGILVATGRVDKAVEILEENYAANPDEEILEETCFALGNIYFNRRNFGKAQTWLTRAPAPASTQLRNPRGALRAHYQLADSYRALAYELAVKIEHTERELELANTQGQDRKLVEKKRESLGNDQTEHKIWLQKAEQEYQWVQDNLVRVPASEVPLSPVEQAQVPFIRADCLFYMKKYPEAQAVYQEQVAYYTKRLEELVGDPVPPGPGVAPANQSNASGMDRNLARWTASRRRLDALAGVLRCAAAQGQHDQVLALDREIRRLLESMDDKTRADWERWLQLAIEGRP